ncbi:MAG: DUF11 domain-containing protein, partial [Chloroflexi bacterium]|nr:DUF11 domain-containing protein [Chloroflexota bacterium]
LDDDRVYGKASPGAPVQVTVTSSLNQVVANTIGDENGDYNVPLYSMDIGHDNAVTVTAGLNRVVLRTPMTLTAQMDAAANTISGYGPPNTTLRGGVDDSRASDFSVTTDGTGHYSFNTNQPPYNHDLQPDNMGGIGVEGAEHEVAYVHFGAVDLWLGMNGAGGAQATPGGRYSYELRYRANRVPARDVVITDTLPISASYISNSRGYSASVADSQVVISVPLIHADHEQSLQLTVEFSSSLHPNDPIHNEAIIGSGQPERNPGDNSAFHDMTLAANNTDVTVWKDPRTGDPAPGQQMIYQIGYHNNGSTGSSEVRITDTLPLSTTFVRWWSDEGGWTLVQSDAQVVWRRDTIQGNQGSSLYLVVRLDGGLGLDQQLHNRVDIFTANDTNLGNNSDDRYVNTGLPRRNLTIGKSFNAGSTTPGGEIRYGLHYNNNGNMAAHGVLLTDTLPPGTTYVDSGYGTSDGWVSVPYSYRVGNDYVWGPATLIPGAFGNFEVVVRVGQSVPAGTILTNTARITSSDGDDWRYDDSASVVETVFAAGPNLHVYKEQRWNGTGQLEYTIHVENRGNEPVNNIWVTDTYPLSTSFSGNWWIPWLPDNTQITATLSNPRRAVFWISQLDGGDTAGIQFQLNLDSGIIDQPGLIFSNMVAATVPAGDTNLSDNTFTAVAFSGPDLYVHSRVVGGVPGPGQAITYELEYGNRSDLWDASGNTTWLVNTLPAGMKYVSAQRAPDLVLGNTLIWLEGRLGRNWMDVIQVTARITSSAKMNDSFTSVTTIDDRNTPSVEPFYDNNTSRMVVALAKARCYVPILLRP